MATGSKPSVGSGVATNRKTNNRQDHPQQTDEPLVSASPPARPDRRMWRVIEGYSRAQASISCHILRSGSQAPRMVDKPRTLCPFYSDVPDLQRCACRRTLCPGTTLVSCHIVSGAPSGGFLRTLCPKNGRSANVVPTLQRCAQTEAICWLHMRCFGMCSDRLRVVVRFLEDCVGCWLCARYRFNP